MNKELTSLDALEKLGNIDVTYNRNGIEGCYSIKDTDEFETIETALKRIDYLERVNRDLQESKDKLIEERNNKIIEHRIVYDDYNFQNIKKFVACKDCQYYENEKCMNKDNCFWLDLEKKLKALEIIKEMFVIKNHGFCSIFDKWFIDIGTRRFYFETQEEYELLKEVLL